MADLVVDLFAGPGGWSEGLRPLGLREVGLEWDTAACLTRAAAGHATIQCDVSQYPTEPFKGRTAGLIASPPCQAWSRAGKGGGAKDQEIVHQLIDELARGNDKRAEVVAEARTARQKADDWDAAWRAAADAREGWWTDRVVREADAAFQGLHAEPVDEPGRVTVKVLSPHGKRERARLFGPRPELFLHDERSILAAEPVRWLRDLRPEWVCMEEVPDVLPLFQHVGRILRDWGYSVWVGVLNAADYGVPQTRRRAILIASRVRSVTAPPPTHTQRPQGEDLFGDSLPGWVSMAEALGWGATDRVSPTVTAGGGKTGGAEPFPTQARQALLNAQERGAWILRHNCADRDRPRDIETGRQMARSRETGEDFYLRFPASDPSPVVTTNTGRWAWERPATTVCATDRLAPPGHRNRSKGGESQFASPDTVRITVEEAAVLQSFSRGYPWQGSKTAQFTQIGNAVPPLLAAHVVAAATGLPLPANLHQEAAA